MSKNIPEIRIQHGWLLQNAFMGYMKMIPEFKEKIAGEPSREESNKIVTDRKETWQKVESGIINAMQEITGLEFYKKTIDVYLVYGYRAAFSNPLTISFRCKGDVFVDVLTHELIHVILTDNTSQINLSKWTEEKFPGITDRKTLNHILVHAIHKEIYINHLKSPERLAYDIEKCQAFPGYKEAWDIVEKEGSGELIEMFRKEYNLI